MHTIYAIVRYISVMTGPDPDYMNDWLTHMWQPVATIVQFVGSLV